MKPVSYEHLWMFISSVLLNIQISTENFNFGTKEYIHGWIGQMVTDIVTV